MQIDLSIILNGISLLVTLHIFRNTLRRDLFRARFEQLIFPLFDMLEPYLYKDVTTVPLDKMFSLFKSQKSLSSAWLIERMYYLETENTQDNYDAVCRLLVVEYSKLSLSLGYGLHWPSYCINRKQYKTNLLFALYVFFWTFILIASLALFGFAVYNISLMLK